jgi:hypothetical protein
MIGVGRLRLAIRWLGPTFAAKGAAKMGHPRRVSFSTLAGFVPHLRSPPLSNVGGFLAHPPRLGFEGVTGFFLDGAKYFSLGLCSTGRGGWQRASIGAKSK